GQQKFIAAETKGKSQKESYELTNQQFQNGLKNVVDVLQSRSLVLQAAQDKLQSKYTTLMNMQLLKFYMGEKLDL
ncbi:MAG: TolC family protein, partial [Bacteroidaceae bacterium]|nr:TolC family protein [Bacteroidaceae bacterium]